MFEELINRFKKLPEDAKKTILSAMITVSLGLNGTEREILSWVNNDESNSNSKEQKFNENDLELRLQTKEYRDTFYALLEKADIISANSRINNPRDINFGKTNNEKRDLLVEKINDKTFDYEIEHFFKNSFYYKNYDVIDDNNETYDFNVLDINKNKSIYVPYLEYCFIKKISSEKKLIEIHCKKEINQENIKNWKLFEYMDKYGNNYQYLLNYNGTSAKNNMFICRFTSESFKISHNAKKTQIL